MIRTIFAATAIAAAIFGAASPAATDTPTPTPTPPPGPTAICNDGTPSYSQHRSGTCSHHGGVKQWCPCDSASGQSVDRRRGEISGPSALPVGAALHPHSSAAQPGRLACAPGG
ncbi:DUF3761 domain-containing protein [Mycobacterium sp.]|uniref:DUF3761 domain-containing protein n=1 Tax=Mycobacterium sp. TaxID=1785 RepID=UPI003F9D4722